MSEQAAALAPVAGQLAAAAGAACAASAVSAPFIMKALVAAKSRQTISQHLEEHKAKQGTPTMGGLIVLVGIAAALALNWSLEAAGAAVVLGAFAAVGFLDDYLIPKLQPGKRGFDWMPKLACQIIAVVAALAFTGRTQPVDFALGLFLVLFFANAYNFSDGLDGLAGGLGVLLSLGFVGVAAAGLAGAALSAYGPLLAGMAGAFLPFLYFNANPAKVFMGDVGALPFGAFFGWAAFHLLVPSSASGPDWAMFWPLFVLSLVMVAELVPVPLQVASAKLRGGKRLFPFKTPIHHGFQQHGWPETRIVALFHVVQGGLVIGAVYLAYVLKAGAP